ncbi:MAG TPA: hypothetical protein VLH56_10985 [Dissulfurispiraceae bacterium]|nr:hypothetical protein [Dissulfurispiraceae bacterium]
MTTCAYCKCPAFVETGFSHGEPLCDKHLEIVVFIDRARRLNIAPTAGAIQNLMRRHTPAVISPDDVPALLDSIGELL